MDHVWRVHLTIDNLIVTAGYLIAKLLLLRALHAEADILSECLARLALSGTLGG